MNNKHKKWLSGVLCAAALLTSAMIPSAAADLKIYDDDDITEIAETPSANGCYSTQGLAVGETYLYSAQIKGDNSRAIITRVNRKTGDTSLMQDAETGKSYFTYLGHANDMDVVTVDGVEYLTVLTYGGTFVVLEVDGDDLKLHGEYVLKRGSNTLIPPSVSVKSVDGSVITFLCKNGQDILLGKLDLDADVDTIKFAPKYMLNVFTPTINGKTHNFIGWLSQGIGIEGDMLMVILTGNHVEETINHSIILCYDLSKATSYRLSEVPDHAFYIVSEKYYGLFEIEDCDVGPDGKIYFNTNGRRMINGSTADAVFRFDEFTFTDVKPLVGTRGLSVSAEAGAGGSISPSGTIRVEQGGEVTCTIRPDQGYRIETVTVNGKPVETDGAYTFSNIQKNQTIKVTFEWDNPFTDVTKDDWFHADVKFVNQKGIMRGTGDTVFSPDMTLTRAQMVTMLWRVAGEPSSRGASFNDVPAGLWYSDAVAWASAKKIVGGYGDGNFHPDDALTREQAVAILHRYAGGEEVGVNTALYLSSDWARGSVSWAAEQGLFNGIGTDVTDQTQPATRAEIAAYLARFCLNAAG